MHMELLKKSELIEKMELFDAFSYAKTRNFVDWWVAKISPYITHWVLTTKECVEVIVNRFSIKEAEKFLMELVRKEFFLQVQKNYGNWFVDTPIWEDKTWIEKRSVLPNLLISGNTKTQRVDDVSQQLQRTWYLHNHKRMWLASWCCHRAKLDWKRCADRTYYHFIDWELSANHLSRQWVNSTFANKAYFMNEENLNKYRPWTSDPNLQWTYEEVFERVFDSDRESVFSNTADDAWVLETPKDDLDNRDDTLCKWADTIRILTPWKLDETLLSDQTITIIVLDETFTQLHPRSENRISFIKQYADAYTIPFVLWSYEKIIYECLEKKLSVILDERYDPLYRDIQEKLKEDWRAEFIDYNRINTHHPSDVILKFFKYRNKTLPFIKKMIR